MKILKYIVFVMMTQAFGFAAENLDVLPQAGIKRTRSNSDPEALEVATSLMTQRIIFKVRRVDRPGFMGPLLIPQYSEESVNVVLDQLRIGGPDLSDEEEKINP